MSDFGDITSDDAFTVGDEDVNWDQVETVEAQIHHIASIEDDEERLEAAKVWAAELDGAA